MGGNFMSKPHPLSIYFKKNYCYLRLDDELLLLEGVLLLLDELLGE